MRMNAILEPRHDIGVPKPRQAIVGPSISVDAGPITDVGGPPATSRTMEVVITYENADGDPIAGKTLAVDTRRRRLGVRGRRGPDRCERAADGAAHADLRRRCRRPHPGRRRGLGPQGHHLRVHDRHLLTVATGDPSPTAGSGTRQTELGALLAGTVTAVVEAQDLLDEHARERAAEYAAAEPGSLALPPLWYAFDEASIELELSTEAVRRDAHRGRPGPHAPALPHRQPGHRRGLRLPLRCRDPRAAHPGPAAGRPGRPADVRGRTSVTMTPPPRAHRPSTSAGCRPSPASAPTGSSTVDGVTGVFTPVTGADAAASTDNLEKIVDALRGELASARAESAALTAKLDALRDPPRSSDDLADGLQHALDGISERLGSMANTTSNFAVREFVLETKVHVDVTPVGTIGFQFVRPGEQVNAAALSTVTMTSSPCRSRPPTKSWRQRSSTVRSRRSTAWTRRSSRPCAGRTSRRRVASRASRPGRPPAPRS